MLGRNWCPPVSVLLATYDEIQQCPMTARGNKDVMHADFIEVLERYPLTDADNDTSIPLETRRTNNRCIYMNFNLLYDRLAPAVHKYETSGERIKLFMPRRKDKGVAQTTNKGPNDLVVWPAMGRSV